MRSFCWGSTSTKRSVRGAQVPERLVLELRQFLAGDHRLRIEPDRFGQMRRDVAIVAADHLDADAEVREVADRLLRVRLGRIGEEQEAGKGHPALVAVDVAFFRCDLACRHGEDAESFRALRLVESLKFRLPVRRERNIQRHPGRPTSRWPARSQMRPW